MFIIEIILAMLLITDEIKATSVGELELSDPTIQLPTLFMLFTQSATDLMHYR